MTVSKLSSIRAWIRENPWIWIVLLIGLFLAGNAVFLKIAFSLPLEVVGPK